MAVPRSTRGRFAAATDAPARGERTVLLAELGGVRVEQVLSGRLDEPIEYRAPVDEWVVLLDGAAQLDIDGEERTLAPGDWLLIPAGVPHRLLRTDPGTRWLTVTARRDG